MDTNLNLNLNLNMKITMSLASLDRFLGLFRTGQFVIRPNNAADAAVINEFVSKLTAVVVGNQPPDERPVIIAIDDEPANTPDTGNDQNTT